MAHDAVFKAWPRLERWIEENAGKLRLLRSLEQSAKDWTEAGSPGFSQLPDRATLKRYKEVKGRATEAAQRYYRAGRKRQRRWQFGWVGIVFAFLTLGFNGWLTKKDSSWNTLRILGLTKLRLYEGPEMIVIRPGQGYDFPADFEMRSTEGKSEEMLVHLVHFSKPFAIGVHEITYDEFNAYCFDKGLAQPWDQDWGRGSRPVSTVTWEAARDYIAWLNEETQKTFRLPTEAEWAYVALAGTTTNYWWGDEVDQDGQVWAICNRCGSESDYQWPERPARRPRAE